MTTRKQNRSVYSTTKKSIVNTPKPSLVTTPQEPDEIPIVIPGNSGNKFPIPGIVLVIGTLIIIGIIVWFTYVRIRNYNPDPVEVIVDPEIVNLDSIYNLDIDGQCCVRPGATNPTSRWIYSPSQDFTFSIDVTDPDIVCQGLTGTNFDACINKVTDSNGEPKFIAHKGIRGYYGFSSGDAGTVCDSYAACP